MTKRTFFVREKDLNNTITRLLTNPGKVAIVGGHYLLLYEKKSNSLRPAIFEEFDDWGNKTWAKNFTRNFPVKSFELTVKLFIHFRKLSILSKCVLLVNDDSFLKKDFRTEEHFELVKEQGHELRRAYFKKNDNIPSAYKRMLKKFSLVIDNFFEKFENIHYTANSTLPKETIFVSERRLCKNFKKTIKSADRSDDLFRIVNIDHADSEDISELTVESSKVNSVCLIEKGICNCGGKAYQFYYDLIQRGFETIIFFVPEECESQVEEGTRLICNSRLIGEKKITIFNIGNIESDPDRPIENKELILSHYLTSS